MVLVAIVQQESHLNTKARQLGFGLTLCAMAVSNIANSRKVDKKASRLLIVRYLQNLQTGLWSVPSESCLYSVKEQRQMASSNVNYVVFWRHKHVYT